MVETGAADAMISGLTRKYSDPIRTALQIIGVQEGVSKVAGMYIINTKQGPFFFADTTMNVNPTVQELVDITVLTANSVKQFNITPRIVLLSYSNFGSAEREVPNKMRDAVQILHKSLSLPAWTGQGEKQSGTRE